jgi:hypothetical protein
MLVIHFSVTILCQKSDAFLPWHTSSVQKSAHYTHPFFDAYSKCRGHVNTATIAKPASVPTSKPQHSDSVSILIVAHAISSAANKIKMFFICNLEECQSSKG